MSQLRALGWIEQDADDAVRHLKRAIDAAAETLQLFRRRMSDVRGKKPAEKATVYQMMKLAAAICDLFEGKV